MPKPEARSPKPERGFDSRGIRITFLSFSHKRISAFGFRSSFGVWEFEFRHLSTGIKRNQWRLLVGQRAPALCFQRSSLRARRRHGLALALGQLFLA